MKNCIVMFIAALMLSATMPAYSQETHQEEVSCELAAKNCLNRVDILEKRIKKLNAEVKKGSKTYSAEDLKKIEQKLQETKDLLDKIEGKSSGK
ncbi:MAG: hypothetical protein ABSA86_03660 [Oryzomonas sp.]